MTAARATLLSILMVSSLAGCAGAGRVPPATNASDGAVRTLSDLRASFKGRMEIGADKQRFEGSLALEAPDHLFVEIAGPVGGVRAVMAVRPHHLVVLLPGTREFIDEEPGPSTYEFLLGLPLDTSGLIELIRLGIDPACADLPCERTIPLAPEAGGNRRSLRVVRRQELLTASLESGDESDALNADARRLELRLRQAASSGLDPIEAGLFDPKIPDGFTRLRPDASRGPAALLLPR